MSVEAASLIRDCRGRVSGVFLDALEPIEKSSPAKHELLEAASDFLFKPVTPKSLEFAEEKIKGAELQQTDLDLI